MATFGNERSPREMTMSRIDHARERRNISKKRKKSWQRDKNVAIILFLFSEQVKALITAVAVAQLVESWIVIPVVVGSSPIGHPKIPL